MTTDDPRVHRMDEAGRVAAERAAQARARVAEINQRLDELRQIRERTDRGAGQPDGERRGSPYDPLEAAEAAAHVAESADRARRAMEATVEAHLAAAEAHESAAAAHEHSLAQGFGEVSHHEQLAREHHALAAADRREADGLRQRLHEEFPDEFPAEE